jgi:hypothetical protein
MGDKYDRSYTVPGRRVILRSPLESDVRYDNRFTYCYELLFSVITI